MFLFVLLGLIPRMMERLFEMIADAPSKLEFTIKASFLEIYNEKIHDLLDSKAFEISFHILSGLGFWD